MEDRRNDDGEEPRSALDIIQRKHSISLLKYLDERGEVMVSDVQRDVTRGKNLDEMLDDYERLGIINRRYAKPQRKPQRVATLLSLTDVGSSFLSLLKAADRCVSEQICLDTDIEEYVNERKAPRVEYEDEQSDSSYNPNFREHHAKTRFRSIISKTSQGRIMKP